MRLYALVLFCLVNGSPIEEYALKISNCLALCYDHSDYTESCSSQCNLWTACSGTTVCRLRCAINDIVCYRACDSFSSSPNCSTPCTLQTLTTGLPPDTLQLSASFSNEEEHVLLLDLIYNGPNLASNSSNTTFQHLTVNSSSTGNVTFQGLYPGAYYRVRAIVFYSYDECCTEAGDVLRAEFNKSEETEFYLAPNLTELFSDSEMYLDKSKEPILYPKYVVYEEGSNGSYSGSDDLKAGSTLSSFLRFRRSDLSKIPVVNINNVRPYLLGAGYIVHVYSKTHDEKKVEFYDSDWDPYYMTPLELQFCVYVPNKDNSTVSVEPKGCVNTTAIANSTGHNITYAEYEPEIELSSIHSCFRSRERNGSIEVPCCGADKSEKYIKCLRGKDEKSNKALFNLNYDYFVYMNNNTEGCSAKQTCSGTFERLNTALFPQCEIGTKPMVIVWVLAGLCTVTVCTASLAAWYYWKDRVNKKQPDCTQSKINDMFDLDRAKIVKHKLIGRGNFGLVFEGKLIVPGGFDFEGEASMDDEINVAIKILKSGDAGEDEQREAREAMRAEINLMKKLQENGRSDRNVLKMIGCVVNASPYMMILELCQVNLKVYLRNHRVEIEDQAVDAEKLATLTHSITPEPINEHEVLRRTATDPYGTKADQSTVLFNRYSLDRNRETDYMDSTKGRMTMSSPCTGSYKDEILSRKKMLDFCNQVAKGMEFLHSIDILHRDIAASNILVQITDHDKEAVLKICDFGQSKMLYKGEYTVATNVNSNRKMFRLRWTAPEVIANSALWSKGSDVWSYGVLIWEIFTLGGTPYPGWPDYTIQSNLTSGRRMACPPVCTENIFEIMSNCWSQNPADRGSFLTIKEKTENMMMDEHNAEFGIGACDYYAFPIDATVDPEKDLEEVDEKDKDIDIRKVDIGSGGLLDEEFVVRAILGDKNEAGEAEIVINMNI